MTRRDWWMGLGVIVLALLLHAMLPRYAWHAGPGGVLLRADRWTGTVTLPTGQRWAYHP